MPETTGMATTRTAEWANDQLKDLVNNSQRKFLGKNFTSSDLVFDTKEGFEAFMRLVGVRDGKCLARYTAQIAATIIDPVAGASLQIHYYRQGRDIHVLSARYRPAS